MTMQLTPTGSFTYEINGSAVGQIISLDQVQGGNWQAGHEHWFRNAGINYATVFGTHKDLTIVPGIQCGTPSPCAALQTLMNTLAAGWAANFQMYAIGQLAPANWSTKKPTVGTSLFFFSAAGTDPKRPRVVFDVDVQDPTKLDRIIWLTDDNSLSTFPVQTLTLTYQGGTLPTVNYYYTATR